MKYRILFVGIGSIAKRHITNLVSYFKEKRLDYEIDIVRSGHGKPLEKDIGQFVNKAYSINDKPAREYDVIFVTNPTALHYSTINFYAPHAKSMFIEKPVFDKAGYDIENLHLLDNRVYYVACPLRYTSVLQYIKDKINPSEVIGVRSICSSYLPEWRSGMDYRTSYSAHKAMGGGVDIDLIHEWDYLTWLFGLPDTVKSIKGNYSQLGIDSVDSALYIANNDHMTYELHLDYYGRKNIRLMQLFLPDETIEADLSNGEVRYLNSGKTVQLHEERNDYQIRELAHYFDIVEGRCQNDSDIIDAYNVLKIAGGDKL